MDRERRTAQRRERADTRTVLPRRARRDRAEAAPEQRGPRGIGAVKEWWSRLTTAISTGTFADETARYASGQTKHDYIANTLSWVVWGMIFPVLSVVATRLVGTEQAGMFSMAMVIGQLLLFVANFGMLTYQVSDIKEMQSFNDYLIHRIICCVAMLAIGVIYIRLRGYDAFMSNVCMGIFLFRMVDGFADVFEGRLQQKDKLYLAGISMTLRNLIAIVAFSAMLFVTRSLVPACYCMAVAHAASVVIVTIPLTFFETERSYPASKRAVRELFQLGTPLFLAIFLFNLLDSVPKFAIEGALTYNDQLYFNAMYFPARGIVAMTGLVYKPQLVRMANLLDDPSKHRQFSMTVAGIFGIIGAMTAVVAIIMATVGIPALSFLYGVDFEQFRPLALIMVVMGGLCASIDFLFQVITVLREQRAVTRLYLIAFVFAVPVAFLLTNFAQLAGAVMASLVIMGILVVLLVTEYLSIRKRNAESRW